ncbi:hypothetical protein HY640_04710 [Candidatus Woesearchaeota archaeon]|nr:hypothetical protein [Candidatus Woesearchaeota archaeon]
MRSKKGEKELQVVFTLLILLIVSVVVLGLFFKMVRKADDPIGIELRKQQIQQMKEAAFSKCRNLCSEAQDRDSTIEFCREIVQMDTDGDGVLEEKGTYGKWEFCEDRIPCSVLLDSDYNCKKKAGDCKKVLMDNLPSVYCSLFWSGDFKGSCNQLAQGSQNNWIEVFGYNEEPSGRRCRA